MLGTDGSFALRFGNHVQQVTKIHDEDFTPAHHETLSQLRYQEGMLFFPDPRWQASFLGSGEEKAVFCVCDHHQRVFAMELINERQYLNGRFVGGRYFFQMRVAALAGVKARADSEFGLTFTGLVKVREFAHGYEWSGFQFDPRKKTVLDPLLTAFLRTLYGARFREFQARYKDVHDRNVLFEIRPLSASGVPLLVKTATGRLALVRVGLQPIDVR